MYYAEIVRAVDRLKRRYHETDPIKLCAAMGIILIPQSLGIAQDAIKGFYLESKRIRTITVNSDPDLLIRRVNVCACNLIRENDIPAEGPEQLSLFFDYETVKKEREAEKIEEEKERNIQRAMLNLQGRFGKNAVLKGMNLMEGATTVERNGQVGGHKAE